MKDLIVTTISENYVWTDINNWISSLKNTTYSGDILVIAYNFEDNHSHLEKLRDMGVTILAPNNTFRGEIENKFVWHSGEVNPSNANKLIHNVRLFHLWQYFNETNLDKGYDRVIFTDGRDVYFQTNPSDWLDSNMKSDVIVPSEAVTYENEPWNRNNLLSNYGPYLYEYLLKEKSACNVGTFACKADIVRDLCLILYLMSNNTGHADQPSFNIITNTLLKDKSQWVDYNDSWALQIGTIVNELDKYVDTKDGLLYPKNSSTPYSLVHQYDRIPHLKSFVDKKFNQIDDRMLSFIIPYRNRENHLSKLLPRLKQVLAGKNYEIIIAEQNDNEKFLLSSLYNIAYKYTSGDTIVFHDVDYYPSDNVVYDTDNDKPFYPVGKLVFLDENDKQRSIDDIPDGYRNFHNTVGDHAGGVFVLPKNVFEKIGGFNPYYRGWGKDDDDTKTRVRINGYEWNRNNQGLFYALYHEDSKPEDNDNDFIRNHEILYKFKEYLKYGYKDVSADVEVFQVDDKTKWLKINNFKYTETGLN
jgi:hypothetical protein